MSRRRGCRHVRNGSIGFPGVPLPGICFGSRSMITLFCLHKDEAEIQVYEKGVDERALQCREVGRPAWNLIAGECAGIDRISQASPPSYGRCKVRSLRQHLVVLVSCSQYVELIRSKPTIHLNVTQMQGKRILLTNVTSHPASCHDLATKIGIGATDCGDMVKKRVIADRVVPGRPRLPKLSAGWDAASLRLLD